MKSRGANKGSSAQIRATADNIKDVLTARGVHFTSVRKISKHLFGATHVISVKSDPRGSAGISARSGAYDRLRREVEGIPGMRVVETRLVLQHRGAGAYTGVRGEQVGAEVTGWSANAYVKFE